MSRPIQPGDLVIRRPFRVFKNAPPDYPPPGVPFEVDGFKRTDVSPQACAECERSELVLWSHDDWQTCECVLEPIDDPRSFHERLRDRAENEGLERAAKRLERAAKRLAEELAR